MEKSFQRHQDPLIKSKCGALLRGWGGGSADKEPITWIWIPSTHIKPRHDGDAYSPSAEGPNVGAFLELPTQLVLPKWEGAPDSVRDTVTKNKIRKNNRGEKKKHIDL